jgi:MFS family permease
MTSDAATLNPLETLGANVGFFSVCRILMITPLLLGTWADLYSLTEQQIGALASLELAGLGVASLSAGLWVDRVNPRVVYMIGLPLIAAGDALTFYLGSTEALFALRGTLGLMAGVIAALGTAMLARAGSPTRTYGYNIAAQFGYGFLTFLLIPPMMVASASPVPLVVVFSLTTLVAAPFALWVSNERLTKPKRTVSPQRIPLAALGILGATVVFFLVQLGVWAFVERMGAALGHDPVPIGQVLSATGLAGGVCALLVARLERLVGLAAVLVIACLLELSGFALLHNAGTFAFYAVALIIFSMGWAMVPPLAFGLLAAKTTSSAITALLPAAQTAGMAIGPALMAMLIRPGDFSLMINTSFALILLFLIIMLPLCRRTT